MNSKLSHMTLSDFIVYIIWTVLVVGKALGLTSDSAAYTFAVLATLPFAALQLLMNPGERWQVVAFILAYLLGSLSWYASGDNSLLLAVIMLSLLKTIDVRSMCTYTLLVCVPIVVIRMTLAAMGFADMQPTYYFERGQYRYGMGFTNPNSAQSVLAFLVAIATVSSLSRRNKRILVLFLLVYSLYMYQFTGCRTALFIELAVGIIFFIPARFRRFKRIVPWLVLAIPLLALLLADAYPLWIGHMQFGTFGSRFQTAYQILGSGALAPFGARTSATDLGYVALLAKAGPIPLAFLVLVNWRAARFFADRGMGDELVLIAAYAVYGVMEAYCTTVTLNPVFLLLPLYLYQNGTGDEARPELSRREARAPEPFDGTSLRRALQGGVAR